LFHIFLKKKPRSEKPKILFSIYIGQQDWLFVFAITLYRWI